MPAAEEERAIGWRQTAERMPARIADDVGFGLDDAPSDPPVSAALPRFSRTRIFPMR